MTTPSPDAFVYQDARGKDRFLDASQGLAKVLSFASISDWLAISNLIGQCALSPQLLTERAEEYASAWTTAVTAARKIFGFPPVNPKTGRGVADAEAVTVLMHFLRFAGERLMAEAQALEQAQAQALQQQALQQQAQQPPATTSTSTPLGIRVRGGDGAAFALPRY